MFFDVRSMAREKFRHSPHRDTIAHIRLRIATEIATGLLTTRRYRSARLSNTSIEISNEIGLFNTRQNALGRLQRFPKRRSQFDRGRHHIDTLAHG